MDNELKFAESLYLRQHKNNPVYWKFWSDNVWSDAAKRDKLVIVSIGYSSCHWCHVMEREVFEHEDAADVMNAHFVSIKVDREERPDIDQVYMTAVQMMSGQGGWPLNVVCLPDKRPIWGATYVAKDQWMKMLLQLQRLYREDPQKVRDYAAEIEDGLRKTELLSADCNQDNIDETWLKERLQKLVNSRDRQWGGYNRAPKFPMPHEQRFLLQAAEYFQIPELEEHVRLTLKRMAWGGIYDYVGGGFCRYAVDGRWKVPHFEKMLYDNAQLLSAFSIAHRRSPSELYKSVVNQTMDFLQAEMKTDEGLYAAAIDADSEGVEGLYYTFSLDELKRILDADFSVWELVFDFREDWEGRFIIFRLMDDEEAAQKLEVEVEYVRESLLRGRRKLLEYRSQRKRPVTDFKVLCSWNGLLLSGFCDAYLAIGESRFLTAAQDLAQSMIDYLFVEGQLFRVFNENRAYIPAMLEDYAAFSRGLLHLFSLTGEEKWYNYAESFLNTLGVDFTDEEDVFFYTTSASGQKLIMRSRELEDNVIPSPNALAADALRIANTVTYRESRAKRWQAMTLKSAAISHEVKSGFHCWGELYLRMQTENREWIVSGKDSIGELSDLSVKYHDFYTDFFVLPGQSDLELFKERYADHLRHFICTGMQCERPLSPEEARAKFG